MVKFRFLTLSSVINNVLINAGPKKQVVTHFHGKQLHNEQNAST